MSGAELFIDKPDKVGLTTITLASFNEQDKLLQRLGVVWSATRRPPDVTALGLASCSIFNHLSWGPEVRRKYRLLQLGFLIPLHF